MPNWCENTVSFYGSEDDINKLIALLDSTEEKGDNGGVFDFSRIIPEPEFDQTESKPGVMPGWYNWRVNTWGTKWNACDARIVNPLQDYQPALNADEVDPIFMITYDFNTAWAPPVGVIYTIAELFPKVAIHCFYDEPGMDFSGLITSMGDGEGAFDDEFGFSISNRRATIDAFEWMDWHYDGPLTKVTKEAQND